jgi:hypothetical protein
MSYKNGDSIDQGRSSGAAVICFDPEDPIEVTGAEGRDDNEGTSTLNGDEPDEEQGGETASAVE